MTSKRQSISKRIRFEVFKRDRFACQYCGRHPPEVVLEIDHIDPLCNGGDDSSDNLITACFTCNRGKSGNLLVDVPPSLRDKAAEIAEAEEQLDGYREVIARRQERIYSDMWQVAEELFPGSSEKGLSRRWLQSIKLFNQRLPLHMVMEAVETTLAQGLSDYRRFKYFCGVCWNLIHREEEGEA